MMRVREEMLDVSSLIWMQRYEEDLYSNAANIHNCKEYVAEYKYVRIIFIIFVHCIKKIAVTEY